MKKHLSHVHEVSIIPYFSGGDADIYSKSGRTTQVQLKVERLRISNDKRYVIARVDCMITETASNHTRLRYLDNIKIPVPRGWQSRRVRIGNDARELNVQFTVSGEQHDWVEVPINDDGTIVEDAYVKIDGRGDDDEGNARLSLHLDVPINVN